MPRTRPPYPPEFRRQILELVRMGRSPEKLAEEFESSTTTIRNWMRQEELNEGLRDDGPTTELKEEIRRLRKEIRKLRMVREILKRAAAWFANETDSIPSEDSSS